MAWAAPAAWGQEIMPTPTPSPAPELVTPPGSGVTASTNDGNLPANTVDGNLATRWSGYGNGAWIEYDLGAALQVRMIHIGAYRGNERKNVFEIRFSTDRVNWRTAFTGQTPGTTTSPTSFYFLGDDARYVRYVGRGYVTNGSGTTGLWNSLTEVAIYSGQTRSIAAPTALTAIPIWDAGAIQLEWTAGGHTRHHVFRSTTPTGPYAYVASVEATRYADWGLQNGVRYCYVVTSGADRARHSRYSNEACAVASVGPMPTPTPTPGSTPSTPTNLTVQHGLRGCDGVVTPLRLSWTASTNATSYTILRGGSPSGPFTAVGTSPTTQWSTSDSSMMGYFVVQAVNAQGASGYSNAVFGSWAVPTCPPPAREWTPPASGVTASTSDTNLPGNTVDSNLSTRWSGYGNGASITFDLGGTRSVHYISVAVYRGNERKNRYDIQVSPDLTTWTTVRSGQTSGTTTGLERIDIPDGAARGVRYIGRGWLATTGTSSGLWNSLTELEIWGQ